MPMKHNIKQEVANSDKKSPRIKSTYEVYDVSSHASDSSFIAQRDAFTTLNGYIVGGASGPVGR